MEPTPASGLEAIGNRWLGAGALAAFVANALWHVADRTLWDALWTCHVASLWIGLGLLLGSARANAVGLSLVAHGNPLWIIDMASGDPVVPTSMLTHVSSLALAVVGVRRLGFPKRTWVTTTLAMLALFPITRLATPRSANVNLAFSIYPGWEAIFFRSYPFYFAFITTTAAGSYWLVERICRRWLVARTQERACDRDGDAASAHAMEDPRPRLAADAIAPEALDKMQRFHADVVAEVQRTLAAHDVVVVGMAQNPHVKKVRRALADAGVPAHYLEYGSYFGKWKERLAIKLWSGWPTFPQVFVKGKLVGGEDLTKAAIADGSLKRWLSG